MQSPLAFWALTTVGLGAVLAWLGALRGARAFGLLSALFLLGSAAHLSLIRDTWFPSLSPRTDLRTAIALGVIALQGAVTLATLWRRRGDARVPPGVAIRALLLLAFLAFAAVSPSVYIVRADYSGYLVKVAATGGFIGLHLLTLYALLLVPGSLTPRRVPPWVWAGVGFAGAALLGWFAFERIPHVEDEVAYLFQARTFAAGGLYAPAPPSAVQPGLEYYLLTVQEDRWLAVTAPGYPLVLALGVLAGVPWLVNPLLTAGSVLLGQAVVARHAGRSRGDLVAMLMACSPWVLAMGGSLMTHQLSLFCTLLAWWCLGLGRRPDGRQAASAAFGAGLALGLLFSARPFEGVLIGGLTGLVVLAGGWRNRRAILAYGLGAILTGMLFFGFNWAVTGSLLSSPQATYLSELWPDTRNAFGFGPDLGPPAGSWGTVDPWPGHGPGEGLLNTLTNLVALNLDLLGWVPGSLLGLGLAIFWARRANWSRFDSGMLAVVVVTIGTMVFYWFSGAFYIGPRYWYVALLPFLALSACGIEALRTRLPPLQADRVPLVIGLLCLVSLTVFTPWRGVTKYHDFRGFHPDLRDAAATGAFGDDVVFVSSKGDEGAALFLNDPFLRPDRPIFLMDKGPEANAAASAALPGRATRWVEFGRDGVREIPQQTRETDP